jgi:hypothetical protein
VRRRRERAVEAEEEARWNRAGLGETRATSQRLDDGDGGVALLQLNAVAMAGSHEEQWAGLGLQSTGRSSSRS